MNGKTPNGRSPEEWEAAEQIENLKVSIPAPGQPPIGGTCAYHAAQAEALIWIIRRLDLAERRGGYAGVWLSLVKSSPLGALAAALLFWGWIVAKSRGFI